MRFVEVRRNPPVLNSEVRMQPASAGTTLMYLWEYTMKTHLFNIDIDPRVVYVPPLLSAMAAAGAGVGPMQFSAP